MPGRFRLSSKAKRQIRKLPPQARRQIEETISQMDMSGSVDTTKLVGYRSIWRTRSGRYRIIWDSETQEILAIGHRASVYGELHRNR